MALEADVRYRIDRTLENKGWILNPDDPLRNVYFESSLPQGYSKKLGRKRPDYTLFYKEHIDDPYIPLGVIEAKKPGADLDKALEQGTKYAQKLQAPLVFAINGTFCKTRYVQNSKSLLLNGQEVKELLRVKEALGYLNEKSNELYTIPKEVIKSRDDMISLFADLNDVLRGEGLRAGIERFSEFANILFLKLLSEHDKSSDWNDIKRQQSNTRIEYINKIVLNRIIQRYGGDVFSPLLIRKPSTLDNIIECLDPLHLTPVDEDIKGGAFEYFLEKTTSTQNDLGEYFTPRHIIKAIVHLVNPRFGETVYDPFCGTGGFLTTAFNYIRDTLENNDNAEVFLKKNSIFGREITTTSRIAKMNMILHGDGHSGVSQIDSLENPVSGQYHVVMTNIPFSQKIVKKGKEGKLVNDVTEKYYESLGKNSGDAVCILHCFKSLRPGGRMAVIVPEGFLFRRDLKPVRQFLLDHANLHSVISLPQGCFLPYTGVKTNILYFTDIEQVSTQKYWYFKVKNDGFTLDNNRRKIDEESDIDKVNASSIHKTTIPKEDVKVLYSIGFISVDIDDIKTRAYNLDISSIDKENIHSDYPLVKLQNVCNLVRGVTYSKDKRITIETDKRILTADNITIEGDLFLDTNKKIFLKKDFPIDPEKRLLPHDILICLSSGSKKHVGKVAYISTEIHGCYAGGFMGIIRSQKSLVNSYYLYCVLNSNTFKTIIQDASRGTNINNLSQTLLNISIPLPDIEVQSQFVHNFIEYQKNINKAKNTIVSMERRIQEKANEIWVYRE